MRRKSLRGRLDVRLRGLARGCLVTVVVLALLALAGQIAPSIVQQLTHNPHH